MISNNYMRMFNISYVGTTRREFQVSSVVVFFHQNIHKMFQGKGDKTWELKQLIKINIDVEEIKRNKRKETNKQKSFNINNKIKQRKK